MSKLESSLSDLVISKENVEKKLLQKFEYLKDPKSLHNFY